MVCAFGPLADAHVHSEVFHRGIEELFQRRAQPVNLVDEENVAGAQRREETDEIAGPLQHRSGGRSQLDTHLPCHEHGERRLAESGRAEEESVLEYLLPAFGCVNGDLQRGFHLGLADELVEARRTERGIRARFLGQRFGSGHLEPRHFFSIPPSEHPTAPGSDQSR